MKEAALLNGKRQREEGDPVANGIQKERERRGKMVEMYSVLQSLVPTISHIHKATREKIVAESTHYIKRLEEEVLRLENLKKSLLGELVVYKPALSQCRNRVSSVKITVSKGVAFLGIQFQLTHGLMTMIFSVLDKHQAEVVAANISVSDHRLATLAITVMIGNNESNTIENIRRELLRF